ncbi:MAG: hypothetical protein HPY53_11400 [Brevinematales bacterium]|nr:hypothetical protein [Brevinematales bacterium]
MKDKNQNKEILDILKGFGRVKYSANEYDHLYEKLFSNLTSYNGDIEKLTMCMLEIMVNSVFFKHNGFEQEKEIRCDIMRMQDDTSIRHRVKQNTMIPYLPIKIMNPFPIASIKIGPCNNFEFVEAGLRSFLDHNDCKDVEIKKSEIPLRY